MRFPLGWKIILLSTLPTVLVAVFVGLNAFNGSMDELKEHEIVDLGDETNLRTRELASQIAMMREDALKLARHRKVAQLVEAISHSETAREEDVDRLRQEVAEVFIELGLQKFPAGIDGSTQKGQPIKRLKPYLQMRLVGLANQGLEIVKVQRAAVQENANPTSDGGNPQVTSSQFVAVDEEDLQTKSGRWYLKQPSEMWGKEAEQEVYLSGVESNQDENPLLDGIPVMRAAVPVADSQGEFFGVIVINLDFDRVTSRLAHSTRHWVYITKDSGDRASSFL